MVVRRVLKENAILDLIEQEAHVKPTGPGDEMLDSVWARQRFSVLSGTTLEGPYGLVHPADKLV